MGVSALTITPFQRRHLQSIRDLLFHSNLVHVHLDWQEADHWLEQGEGTVRLAWMWGRLAGLIGASKPLNGTSWIRVAAVHDQLDPDAVLQCIWHDLAADLKGQGVHAVGLLMVRDWLLPHIAGLGFTYQEHIVTLARAGHALPELTREPVMTRSAGLDDLPTLVQVDHSAFDPPWQMSALELRLAERQSSSCTVALIDNQVVGYQLSTLYFDGAHLARLGVLPSLQGQGIGAALLADALRRFFRRGVYTMTVNTQSSNQRSLRLYEHYGFRMNGFDLGYWLAQL
jgi:ribosomal-protein-alanine N-acetyltransferase